ncbi:AraC family transcriptional regulator [uncultured Roseobacter sp.]|uniref:AraC family transcriptional regulator n=1 Tax=uncultured Roseobacter sp. TaxID=114847 RepID=UPI00260E9ABB|nr:AraC family transcriptional regulator [uncultured Roseobacter sp.]
MQGSTYLANHAVLETTDLSEARSAVADKYCDHRLDLIRGHGLDMRYNHVPGAQSSLNVLSYGGDVRINPGELHRFYLLQIPVAGKALIKHRGEEVEADVWTASILNPDRPTDMEWSADCTKVMLQIDADFLNIVACEDLGFDLPGPVRFDPKVDLSRSPGLAVREAVLSTVRAYEDGTLGLGRQRFQEMSLERSLARTLLSLQPSNVSQYFEMERFPIVPKQIKRAIEFVQTEYHRDLRLDDIAVASGLHPRSLQSAFRSSFAVSPMDYLKTVRLNAARYRLCRRRNRESVTDVAFGCGFSHLGRFSRDYRARFGHAPSETV